VTNITTNPFYNLEYETFRWTYGYRNNYLSLLTNVIGKKASVYGFLLKFGHLSLFMMPVMCFQISATTFQKSRIVLVARAATRMRYSRLQLVDHQQVDGPLKLYYLGKSCNCQRSK